MVLIHPIKLLYTIDGVKVRLGNGTYSSNKVLYTFDRNKVRRGDGVYSSNKVLLTIDGNKNQTGDGIYSSNKVLYTIDGNKIRQGDGTYSPPINSYIDGNKIRQGDGTYSSNKVLYTTLVYPSTESRYYCIWFYKLFFYFNSKTLYHFKTSVRVFFEQCNEAKKCIENI
jgi:hypothetical protein